MPEDKILKSGVKIRDVNLIKKVLENINGVMVVGPYPGYFDKNETIGRVVNEKLLPIYNSAENKMIITGRNESLRKDVEEVLFTELKLEKPNFGLYLYAGKSGIANYKAETIINSVRKNGWNEIHLYEDKEKWLESISKAVTGMFPNVKFVKHLVTNLKEKISL